MSVAAKPRVTRLNSHPDQHPAFCNQLQNLGLRGGPAGDLEVGPVNGYAVPSGGAIDRGKAEEHVQKMLDRISSAHQSGMRKRAEHLTQEYLRSNDAKYTAVLHASAKLKKHRRPNPGLLPSIARGLNAWEGTDEKVLLMPQEKEDKPNEYRPILDFGIENRALQYLARSVLAARADLHPNQYVLRGVHQAIGRIADLMAQGYNWAVETDIKDCYPSFYGEKVPDLLPLPKRVTRSCLLGDSLRLCMHRSLSFGQAGAGADEFIFSHELAVARRGFPQGSAASPLAVEMLLAPLFAQLPYYGTTIGYADNFLAMAMEESDVVAISTAFWSALKAHPAGHLRPNKPRTFTPAQPVEFLGHSLRRRFGGHIQIEPTHRNQTNFNLRLDAGLKRILKLNSYPSLAAQYARELRGFVCSWTAAFKLCAGIESIRARAFIFISMALSAGSKSSSTYFPCVTSTAAITLAALTSAKHGGGALVAQGSDALQ